MDTPKVSVSKAVKNLIKNKKQSQTFYASPPSLSQFEFKHKPTVSDNLNKETTVARKSSKRNIAIRKVNSSNLNQSSDDSDNVEDDDLVSHLISLERIEKLKNNNKMECNLNTNEIDVANIAGIESVCNATNEEDINLSHSNNNTNVTGKKRSFQIMNENDNGNTIAALDKSDMPMLESINDLDKIGSVAPEKTFVQKAYVATKKTFKKNGNKVELYFFFSILMNFVVGFLCYY